MSTSVTRAAQILAFSCLFVVITPSADCQTVPVAPATPATAATATDADAPADADNGGVDFALRRYVVVFNSHDPDKLAALWTPDGVYVDKATGQRTAGRDALAADFRALFEASPAVQLSGEIEGVRLISDDVAMVDGTTVTVAPDEDPSASAYSAIFVKRDGKWLVDSVHEQPLPTPDSPRQALEPLAWLVGQWRDDGDAGAVETTVHWSPSEVFLLRSFNVQHEGEDPLEGTQVIAWDPRAKLIRSWTFNSDGSFGEGVWTRSGDEWLVRTTQTLADGRAATATQVITQVDDATATVQTIGKEIDGAPEPNSEPVTVTRVETPAEGQAAAEPENAAAGAASEPVAAPTTEAAP
jgi:uncharacterized protein (TIGR02246 family)